MVRSKHEIWKKFGDPYQHDGLGGEEESTKSKYCKCCACDELIIAASARLRDHWDKCKKRPRAIGQLDAGFRPSRNKVARLRTDQGKEPGSSQGSTGTTNTVQHSSSLWSSSLSATRTSSSSAALQLGLGTFSPSGDTDNDSSFFSGGRQHFDYLKAGKTERLNVLFARAVHRTATPYSAFSHPTWKAFFHALRGCYQLPSRASIGGELMQYEYSQ